MPSAKKGQQLVPTLKKTTGPCPSRCYYATYTSTGSSRATVQPDQPDLWPGPAAGQGAGSAQPLRERGTAG